MTRAPDLDLQALLAEEPFVRALCGALAANDADDLAQQTWLLALQQRGPVEQPRSWLRRIARNVAANLARSDRHRAQRERAAAVRERLPSSAELLEREERRRALVHAVDRLPGELREVVLLRWFEGLPPRRIAVELGLPVSTVWNRLRSALQRLRERLDLEHDGDRRAWLLPLLPVQLWQREPAAPAWPLLLAGACTMTTKTKVAGALAVLLLLAFGYAWWPDPGPLASAPSVGANQTLTGSLGASAPQQQDAEPGAATERLIVPPVASAIATTGRLLVRAVHGEDRRPAANETLVLFAHGANSPLAERRFRTDAGGLVRVDALPPGILHLGLLQHEHRQRVEIQAGRVTEIEYVLPPGLAIDGIVVDGDERPVAGAEIDLFHFGSFGAAPVTTADAEGRFALRHAWPMSYLGARSADHAASRLQMLMGSEGGAVDVKIQLLAAGGAVAGTVWGPDAQPIADAVIRVGTAAFEGPFSSLGLPPAAVPIHTDALGHFLAVGLEAGEQRVFVRATGLAPWQGNCFVSAHATASLRVDLGAGASCSGIVRDGDGKPAAGVDVMAGRRKEFTHCGTETAGDGTFTLTGLAVGELEVRASHELLGKGRATVASRAGVTVTCELTLSRGIELRGRVVDETGAPMSGVWVHAYTEVHSSEVGGSGNTDVEGRFTLPNCQPGLLTVAADKGQEQVQVELVDPKQGEIELRLRRVLPAPAPSARIRGRVIGPDGRAVAGTRVTTHTDIGDQCEGATGADGTFTLGPLRPGTWRVYVSPQRYPGLATEPREVAADATCDVGTLQLVEGGTALMQVIGPAAGADLTFSIRDGKGGGGGAQWIGDRQLRTWVLAPGDYRILLVGQGCALRWVPFTIRAGEETRVAARLEPGIRQRFEFVRADGVKLTIDLVHSLRRDDELLIDDSCVYVARPASHGPDGAAIMSVWLAPGSYRMDVHENGVAGSAEFTIGAREGPAVRIVLR